MLASRRARIALVTLAAAVVVAAGLFFALQPLCACEYETGDSPRARGGAGAGLPSLIWGRKADLPTPRSEGASAVLDGRIYVIAGFDAAGNSTAVVEVYDPQSDAWQRRAELPEGRDHAMAAAFGGKVYVFGGGGRGGTTSSVFAYDPGSDAWTRVAEMPLRRTAGGAAVLGDRIIVAGGTGDSPTTTMLYDPAADRWTAGPPLPAPREHLAVVGSGSRVYVIGGRWQDDLKATNEVLEPASGGWRRLADLPTARGGTAGGAANGAILVAGGEAFNPTRTFPQVEMYRPESDSWVGLEALPTPRHGLAVQGVGNVVYVIGGGPTAGLSVSPRNEALAPPP
jgi:N-acetylneuraminic acid mutarotase